MTPKLHMRLPPLFTVIIHLFPEKLFFFSSLLDLPHFLVTEMPLAANRASTDSTLSKWAGMEEVEEEVKVIPSPGWFFSTWNRVFIQLWLIGMINLITSKGLFIYRNIFRSIWLYNLILIRISPIFGYPGFPRLQDAQKTCPIWNTFRIYTWIEKQYRSELHSFFYIFRAVITTLLYSLFLFFSFFFSAKVARVLKVTFLFFKILIWNFEWR